MPPPADGSSIRGGSTSVRGRVRSPLMAKLQAASVPIAQGSCALRAGTERRTDRLAMLQAASMPIAQGSCAPRTGTDKRTNRGIA